MPAPNREANQRKAADAISADYVSPMLRWAFAREDRPDRTLDYDVIAAADSGIHPAFLGETVWFIKATIHTPGHPDAVGMKAVPTTMTTWGSRQGERVTVPVVLDHEQLVVLQTKALGRACKQLGYPDGLPDFRAMVLWRQRNREIAILGTTPEQAALPAGQTTATQNALDEALNRAAVQTPADESMTPNGIVDADSTESQPSQMDIEIVGTYAEVVATLDGPRKGRLAKWLFEEHSHPNVMRINDPALAELALNWLETTDGMDSSDVGDGDAGVSFTDGGGNE